MDEGTRKRKGNFEMKMRVVCAGILILAAVLFGVLWFRYFVSVPLVISPETTDLTAPLSQDGRRVDYLAHIRTLDPPEMKTDRNAARILVRQLGTPGADLPLCPETSPQEYEAQKYALLGLTQTEPEIPSALGEYCSVSMLLEKELEKETDSKKREDLEKRIRRVEFLEDAEAVFLEREFLKEWVQKNSPALDAAAKAIRESDLCVFPLLAEQNANGDLLAVNPMLSMMRDLALDFVLRASWRAAMGDHDGALEDHETLFRYAQLIQKTARTYTELFVALSIETAARCLTLAPDPGAMPTKEDWLRFAESGRTPISETQLKERVRAIFSGVEYWTVLSGWQSAANGHFQFGSKEILPILKRWGWDWNEVVRQYREDHRKLLQDDRFWNLEKWAAPVSILNVSPWDFLCMSRAERSRCLGHCSWSADITLYFYRHAETVRKFQQLGVAFQLYRLEHDGKLPPAFTRNAEGKPLHSWRVLLLPYLGETELFEKLRLDEPWDSEWNRQFHDQCPAVFQLSGMLGETELSWKELAPGETNCTVFIGEKTLFPTDGSAVDPVQLANAEPARRVPQMILAAERIRPVGWMVPDAELTAESLASPDSEFHPIAAQNTNGGVIRCGRGVFFSGAVGEFQPTLDPKQNARFTEGGPDPMMMDETENFEE